MRQLWIGAALLGLLQAPAFEVASVKPNTTTGVGVTGGCHGAPSSIFQPNNVGALIPTGRCVIASAALRHLILIAYDVPTSRIQSGPDLVWGNERFDVEAKAEDPAATYPNLKRMLQTLLADRFKLRVHRETRVVSGYALVVAPNGPKFRESRSNQEPSFTAKGAAVNKFDARDQKNLNLNTFAGRGTSMAQLAEALSRLPGDMPVADKTGLTGVYDITLEWEPDESPAKVLQEQLGLRLDPQDVPVEFIIIDAVERPTEN